MTEYLQGDRTDFPALMNQVNPLSLRQLLHSSEPEAKKPRLDGEAAGEPMDTSTSGYFKQKSEKKTNFELKTLKIIVFKLKIRIFRQDMT